MAKTIFWLNLGLAFPHKDGRGFNVLLQAFPLDGKIVCREVTGDEGDQGNNAVTPVRPQPTGRGRR